MNKPVIHISDFTYTLPDERIAKYPLKSRDSSKLLIYRNKKISHTVFSHLPDILSKDSLLVFNNSKVIRARLNFKKETGAAIEIFCLEPVDTVDVQLAFETTGSTTWKCIVGNAKKWKQGALTKNIGINDKTIKVKAEKVSRDGQSFTVKFSWDDKTVSFAEVIESIGTLPIPPYLNRETEEIDNKRYQTVYSKHKGSVAAPTAGLHFTDELLSEIKKKGIGIQNITLHVGAGTFKPVQTETIDGHEMHTEHFVVEAQTVKTVLQNVEKIVAVGTTSVRTLESLYWLGVRLLENMNIADGINQWDPYNIPAHYPVKEALKALMDYMQQNNLKYFNSKTAIIIVPGYRFRLVKTLITNFHQPKSTLLLLIGAFIGHNWKDVYDYALKNNFRFLSYGDSSILFRKKEKGERGKSTA